MLFLFCMDNLGCYTRLYMKIFGIPASSINSTSNPLISPFSSASHFVCTIIYVLESPLIELEKGSLYWVKEQEEAGMACVD